jgi:dihydroorotate dehydrogenase (fumarate)
MADLRVKCMGLELKNPLIVGASSLTKQVDNLRQMEAAGAAAVVLKSLFEEQVQLERAGFEDSLAQFDHLYAEAVHLFPKVSHGGPKEHLFWVKESKKAVGIPVIASLNAVNEAIWVDYAKQLAETGVDAIELNFYSLPIDPKLTGADIEKRELDAFAKVRAAVKIPLAVKLHSSYTSVSNVAASFARLGASSVVLFNRLFQPDLSVEKETERANLVLSESRDLLPSLRWVAILHGRIEADLIAGTGILSSQDVVKMLLAGATAVQVVSALYRHRISFLGDLLKEIGDWMDAKGYKQISDFRGKASKKNVKDPWAFERGQYIKALLGFD